MARFGTPQVNLYVELRLDELVAAGAASMSAPHDWLDGRLRVAWVADPSGNPVELVQRRSG